MMQNTRNPTRRNRNIGTVKQGHGQNNALLIPESCHTGKPFYETLMPYIEVTRKVNGHALTFIVQRSRPGWFYPCTVDDICTMLGYLPVADIIHVQFIVLRQRTRKENILCPVWGRWLLNFNLDHKRSGAAIMLEACSLKPYR